MVFGDFFKLDRQVPKIKALKTKPKSTPCSGSNLSSESTRHFAVPKKEGFLTLEYKPSRESLHDSPAVLKTL